MSDTGKLREAVRIAVVVAASNEKEQDVWAWGWMGRFVETITSVVARELDVHSFTQSDLIAAALCIHQRKDTGEEFVCSSCRSEFGEPWAWPCPTAEALEVWS